MWFYLFLVWLLVRCFLIWLCLVWCFFGFGLAFLKICADFTLICHCGLLSWLVIAICHCKRARKREAWQSRCFRHWKRIYQNPRGNLVVLSIITSRARKSQNDKRDISAFAKPQYDKEFLSVIARFWKSKIVAIPLNC